MHHKLRMAQVLGLMVAGVLAAPVAAKEKAEDASLREQLKAQYKLAQLSGDSLDTAEGGTVLSIEKPGILGGLRFGIATMYRGGVLHAPGKIELAIMDASIQSVGQEPLDRRPLPVGDKVYVLRIDASVKRERIQFGIVECNACNGVTEGSPYESTVEFQFPKGYLESASLSQVEDTISQVFAIDSSGETQQAQTDQTGQMAEQGQAPGNPLVIPTPPLRFPSTYASAQAQGDRLQLNADHSFSLQEAGQAYHGSFVVVGNTLELSFGEPNIPKTTATLQGNNLINSSGQTWVLEGQSAGTVFGGTGLQNMGGGNLPPPPTAPEAPLSPACGNYASCLSSGRDSLNSSQWDQSVGYLQKASSLDPSQPDAWTELGRVYVATGQYQEGIAMWDKALGLGGTLILPVWHWAGTHLDRGTFYFSAKEASFVGPGGGKIFSAAPAELSSVKSHKVFGGRGCWSFGMKVTGHQYWFSFVPGGVECSRPDRCGDPGNNQEEAISNYVAQAIGKLAPGSVAK